MPRNHPLPNKTLSPEQAEQALSLIKQAFRLFNVGARSYTLYQGERKNDQVLRFFAIGIKPTAWLSAQMKAAKIDHQVASRDPAACSKRLLDAEPEGALITIIIAVPHQTDLSAFSHRIVQSYPLR